MPNGGHPSAGEIAGDKAREVAGDLAQLNSHFTNLLTRMMTKGLLTSAECERICQIPAEEQKGWSWDHTGGLDFLNAVPSIPPGAPPKVIPIEKLLANLRQLADMWDDQATRDPYRHGDAWARSRSDCAEQLREVLRGT